MRFGLYQQGYIYRVGAAGRMQDRGLVGERVKTQQVASGNTGRTQWPSKLRKNDNRRLNEKNLGVLKGCTTTNGQVVRFLPRKMARRTECSWVAASAICSKADVEVLCACINGTNSYRVGKNVTVSPPIGLSCSDRTSVRPEPEYYIIANLISM